MSLPVGEISRIVIFFTFFVISWGWLVFVLLKIYAIIVPGLRKLFYIFIVHLVILYPMMILYLVRPVWTAGMAGIYHSVPILCHAHTRLGGICYVFSLYMPTLFNFCKIKFYFEVFGETSSTRMQSNVVFSLTILLLFFLLLGVIRSKSDPFIENDTRLCFKFPDFWVTAVLSILWFIVNAYTMFVSFRHRSKRHPLYPILEPQMKVNIYVVPVLFLSTAIARLLPVVVHYGNYGDMAFKTFTKTMPALVDHLLNSCVMYWFLFGNAEINFMLDENLTNTQNTRQIVDSRSRSRSPGSPEPEHWISFTGVHPVRLDEEFIFNNNLQSLIIPQHLQQRQKELYHQRQLWEKSWSSELSLSRHNTLTPTYNPFSNNSQTSEGIVVNFQPHDELTE